MSVSTLASGPMVELVGQVRRFVVVGAANTAATVALLVGLDQFIDPSVAYLIVFLLGLGFSTVMTSRYVFRGAGSWSRTPLFVCWYVGVLLIGLAVVRVLNQQRHWASLPLAVVTVMVTAPLSFAGARMIFRDGPVRTARVREPG